MKTPCIITILSLAALGLASPAQADGYSPSEDANRRGIIIGGGLHGGHIDIDCGDGCGGELNEAGGAELHVTYMMSRKLGLSVEGWGMVHTTDTILGDVTATHVLATIGLQYWALPRLWVRVGGGYARGEVTAGDITLQSEQVPGVALGVGFEILTSRTFALDIQLRGGTGFYEDGNISNGAIGLGFSWF